MNKEIERKFLIKKLPDLSLLKKYSYERYFIFNKNSIEIRIQKKWEIYEFERKVKENNLSSLKQKFEISKEEFDCLKKISDKSIFRDSYIYSENPSITIKIYHKKFKWLKRVEVEFLDEESAKNFKPYTWFWKEITNLSIWKDSKLISLDKKEFNKFLTL